MNASSTARRAAGRAGGQGAVPVERTTRRAAPPVRPGGVRGSRLAFWVFVSPFLVGLVLFTVVPILWSSGLSFFEARGTLDPTRFVGLDNYARFLTDKAFTNSLGTFTVFAVFIVPVTMAVSLGLAVLVNGLPRFQAFFRSALFLPVACSYVVGALVWKLSLFSGLPSGIANTVLGGFGADAIAWLGSSPYWWIVLVTVRLWLQVGFYMLLFLAGLQRIPQVLYEAALIDGVSAGVRRFRYITWPQLRPTVAAVLLLLLVAAFQAFDEFLNLVPANPATRPPLVYLYNVALGAQRDFGLGSAGALILTAIMVVVALLQTRFFGFAAAEDRQQRTRRGRREVAR
ncbi:carbohydrate ABC transporter permease [Kineococcus sp. SYSU DK003]|uniref:carbohydrate ABC transporter permease n=1 Tax=Kineococcus sp. SYSU DK003 TaxID=3383124 RepID=UPI003D7DD2A7